MPTYEYACTECGHEFEAFQSIKDAALTECPDCGKNGAKRQISLGGGFILKGGGWYSDLYGSSKSSGSGVSEKSAETASSDTSGAGSSSTGSGGDAGSSSDAGASGSTTSGGGGASGSKSSGDGGAKSS